MECLFNNTSKFALSQEDPKLHNMSIAQTFLNTFYKRNKIKIRLDKN